MSKRKLPAETNVHHLSEISLGYGFRSKRGRLAARPAAQSEHNGPTDSLMARIMTAAEAALPPTAEEDGQDLTFTFDQPPAASSSNTSGEATKLTRGITVSGLRDW